MTAVGKTIWAIPEGYIPSQSTSGDLAFLCGVLKALLAIGGVDLPAGIAVSPCIYLAHRRPEAWPEPERYRPERFLDTRPSLYEFGWRRLRGPGPQRIHHHETQ